MPHGQDFWPKTILVSLLLHAGKLKAIIREATENFVFIYFLFYLNGTVIDRHIAESKTIVQNEI